MRVGLNTLFLLPGVVGGTETYAVGLLEALAKISDLPQYIVFTNKETNESALFRGEKWLYVSCSVPARLRVARYAWEQIVLPLQAKKFRLDVLHSLGYVQPLSLPCKSVVTIHDLNFHNLAHLIPPMRRTVLRYLVTRSARVADHIITVSEFSKSQIMGLLGVAPEKITVTYNAVKLRPSQMVESEVLERKYGVTSPYILALSSQSPHKNIGNLVKAFALLRQRKSNELKLVLAGHLPQETRVLAQALKESKVGDGIVFTGRVSNADLSGLYSHAEAFIFPSVYEGFGIPILEAFTHGTPVVCSTAAAIPEVAGNAACYFNPYDVEEMACAIESVLTSKALRAELVGKGKSRARLFTWEVAAQRTLAVYEQIMSLS